MKSLTRTVCTLAVLVFTAATLHAGPPTGQPLTTDDITEKAADAAKQKAEDAKAAGEATADAAKATGEATGEAAKAAVEGAKEEATTAALVCPVSQEPAKENIFVMQGETKVNFCCRDCRAKFKKDPSAYLNADGTAKAAGAVGAEVKAIQEAKPAAEGSHKNMEGSHK